MNWEQLRFAPYGKIGKILVKERKEFLNRLQNEMNEIYERENAWKASVRKMEELLRKGHSLAIDLLNVYNLYKYDIQETPIRNIFEQHEIRLLSDDCSFEEYKVKVQNIILETKQNQQEVYNHIVGSPKNKRMIKNFIKYHKDYNGLINSDTFTDSF